MTITWLGHACFLVESGGYRVIIDPCKGVPGVPDTAGTAEKILCSHSHFDHCYTEKICILDAEACPFTVREIQSFHDDAGGTKRGANTIHVLTAGNITVVHLGDLGHLLSEEQVAAIGRCDVLLIPVGGTYTLDVHAAKKVAEQLSPRLICPMHYRRSDMGFEVLQTVDEFTAQYSESSIRKLNGSTLTLTEDVLTTGGIAVFHL